MHVTVSLEARAIVAVPLARSTVVLFVGSTQTRLFKVQPVGEDRVAEERVSLAAGEVLHRPRDVVVGRAVPGEAERIGLPRTTQVVAEPVAEGPRTQRGAYADVVQVLLHDLIDRTITANNRVSYWIDVATKANTPPGDYTATVTVQADGITPITLQLSVHVWDFELPSRSNLPTAFSIDSLWQASWVCAFCSRSSWAASSFRNRSITAARRVFPSSPLRPPLPRSLRSRNRDS